MLTNSDRNEMKMGHDHDCHLWPLFMVLLKIVLIIISLKLYFLDSHLDYFFPHLETHENHEQAEHLHQK